MNYIAFTFLFLLFSLKSIATGISATSMAGRIKFCSNPFPVAIYHSGTKISSEINPHTKELFFHVPKINNMTQWIIITEPLSMQNFQVIYDPYSEAQKDSNTIDYLKISPNQKYLLYKLSLKDQKWIIKEESLDESHRIPDNAIIVCCNPDFVSSIEGSNLLELPTIKMHHDPISLVGSEEEFNKVINQLTLASINMDTIHSRSSQVKHIKIADNRVIIAAPLS